jgi:hypothetical protein
MAATTGIFDANVLLIYSGTTAIAHSRDFTITSTMAPRDITSQADVGVRKLKKGVVTHAISGSAFYAQDATLGFSTLFASLKAGTELTIKLSNENAGDKKYTATALVVNLTLTGEVNGTPTFSYNFDVSGDFVEATI